MRASGELRVSNVKRLDSVRVVCASIRVGKLRDRRSRSREYREYTGYSMGTETPEDQQNMGNETPANSTVMRSSRI